MSKLSLVGLSSPLVSLLEHVVDSQLAGHYDSRGYYAEYDNSQCKPYGNMTLVEAQELDFLSFHKDSDKSREAEEDYYETEYHENDDGEEEEEEVLVEDFVSGVSFVSVKPEYLEELSNLLKSQ